MARVTKDKAAKPAKAASAKPAKRASKRRRTPPPSPLDEFFYNNLILGSLPSARLVMQPKGPAVDAAKLEALKAAEPYRVTQRVPDMVEVITAWRAWDVRVKNQGLRLEALGKSVVWEPHSILTATCVNDGPFGMIRAAAEPRHLAPHMDCDCGVWAFKSLDNLVSALKKYSGVRVLGTVSLWGRVIETENGYRAQYAYPSELWLLDSTLEELGLIYDVPVRLVKE